MAVITVTGRARALAAVVRELRLGLDDHAESELEKSFERGLENFGCPKLLVLHHREGEGLGRGRSDAKAFVALPMRLLAHLAAVARPLAARADHLPGVHASDVGTFPVPLQGPFRGRHGNRYLDLAGGPGRAECVMYEREG